MYLSKTAKSRKRGEKFSEKPANGELKEYIKSKSCAEPGETAMGVFAFSDLPQSFSL